MITTLHIKNIGIIDDISIDLNNGLNVLTGETGAGKTLIIDSLSILSGERFSKEMIRQGEESSFVEACLYLPNNPNSIDGDIIISREIWTNGRNLCKINGRMVTVNELRDFMTDIIDIHGQHDNQTLMNAGTHLALLDAFSQECIENNKQRYQEIYAKYLEVKSALKENYGDDKEKQRRLDLLKYQAKEISDAKLKIGEDDELQLQKEKISNTQKIAENLQIANNQIDEVSIDAISSAIRALEKIEEYDADYAKSLSELKNIYYELQETGRDISSYTEDVSFEDERIEEIEERLDLIFSLKRKYGNSIKEILEYKDETEQEISKIENLENYIIDLKNQAKNMEEEMTNIAKQIHDTRQKEAKILESKINEELKDLEMKNAKFEVSINLKEGEFKSTGLDSVEFLIKTNVGEDAKPLIKIASGGEMSRIMLAIKTVLADVDEVPILVFDEIDTGISGAAANAVAEKLNRISNKHQVICVTHLASIAATGEYNYFIGKQVHGNKTKTEVKRLTEEETIQEIARIASGVITEVTLNHAKELRKNNK
ncbi:MAG: DNA repair protein RecN [Clostridia bacterium]|nr:DNA repair protein RecN [Clostridia bacterium]